MEKQCKKELVFELFYCLYFTIFTGEEPRKKCTKLLNKNAPKALSAVHQYVF